MLRKLVALVDESWWFELLLGERQKLSYCWESVRFYVWCFLCLGFLCLGFYYWCSVDAFDALRRP